MWEQAQLKGLNVGFEQMCKFGAGSMCNKHYRLCTGNGELRSARRPQRIRAKSWRNCEAKWRGREFANSSEAWAYDGQMITSTCRPSCLSCTLSVDHRQLTSQLKVSNLAGTGFTRPKSNCTRAVSDVPYTSPAPVGYGFRLA